MRLKELVQNAPSDPGVYQMVSKDGEILYIGKAKNLNKRLKSYISRSLNGKTLILVKKIHSLELTITPNESEALLLESRLVRKYQPRYNVLLKDDKSFPYIMVRIDHDFPQINKYRGKIDLGNKNLFGPFANVGEVNNALKFLQKTFKLRNCTDNYFKQRTRPCLQYQIGRCSAPCVGKISTDEYGESVEEAKLFLRGQSKELQKSLAKKMEEASKNTEYEKAASFRDRIKNLSYIQLKGDEIDSEKMDFDIVAASEFAGIYGIIICFYRKGQFYGQKIYFPEGDIDNVSEAISSFIGMFYQNHKPPKEILLNAKIEDEDIYKEAIKQLHNIMPKISIPVRGYKNSLLISTIEALEQNIRARVKASKVGRELLDKIADLFDLASIPKRIEIYDNSHIMGSYPVGAMVVSKPNGFDKKEYRIYNVENKIGDDYAMLAEVLSRRMKKIVKKEGENPDLIIIDGGKGHLSVARRLMDEMDLSLNIVSMSKGVQRNDGKEVFHKLSGESFTLDRNLPVMKYLQIMRDEAHHFAISNHRKRRSKSMYFSSLDDIQSIGPMRKKALLNYFGGIEEIRKATIEELAKVDNISHKMAKNIYDQIH
jgi:excinuclease ABC subunit C